ncbi:MAG: cullin [archaeon]|nr:cullin [archaeon]
MQTVNVSEQIKIIEDSMITGLLKYLETGEFAGNSPSAYMAAYTAVHKVSDEGDVGASQTLFDFYISTITKHIQNAMKKMGDKKNEELVDAFLEEERKCNFLSYWMRRIFTYLDKFFTQSKATGTLCENALKLFRKHMFLPLKEKLFDAVNKLIKEDRECNVIYRFKIKNMLKIIENVDLLKPEILREGDRFFWAGEAMPMKKDDPNEPKKAVPVSVQPRKNKKGAPIKEGKKEEPKMSNIQEWFEGKFTEETIQYAKSKGTNAIHSMSAQEYIFTILKYLDEEDSRKNEYINKNFWPKLDEMNNDAFVKDNTKPLADMETGFAYMFKNKKDDELKDAYRLVSRVRDCLKHITTVFDVYIRERGNELYKNKDLMKDPLVFIPKLIDLEKEMSGLVTYAFKSDTFFQDAKNKAFALFMNKEFYSKQLSNYTDYLMKRGIKAYKENEIEQALTDVISLFTCLSNKLAFQMEANKKLRDRLIQGKSISLVAEKNFIQKLKANAGVTYVNKMTEMMKDLELSKGTIDQYRKSAHKGKPKGISFTVQVVSQSAWEIEAAKMAVIEIPQQLKDCMSDFNDFYIKLHKTHKLTWCYGLGTLDVQFLYLPKKYISVSTLMQYAMLCKLEKYGKNTIEKLSNMLGVDSAVLAHEASGLVFNPTFNKNKNPAAGIILGNFKDEMTPQTEVEINPKFACNSIKFQTLPMISRKTNQNQEQEDAINVKKYQDILLQMNITRIMKSRIGVKTNHSWLVSETAKQVEMFKAQPQQIKEAIEKLIEKNIMKRCEDDRTCYEYVA